MAGVRVEIDESGVVRMIGEVLARLENLKPPLDDFGEYMIRRTWERFDRETGPDGKRWKPLKPATLARKKIDKILTETSNLKDRVVYQADQRGLTIGTNVIYAAIHQFGGKAGRKRSADIPARPFLGVDQDDLAELEATLTEWVDGGGR